MPIGGAVAAQPTIRTPSPTNRETQFRTLQSAASAAGIPTWVLVGVYGAESTYGTAYSQGQTTYGYFGLTSPGLWNPTMTFQQDATTAANLLAKLYKQHGNSWDAALRAYSGGGYGAAHAQQMAANAPAGLKSQADPISSAANAVAGGASSVANAIASPFTTVADAVGAIASLVTSGSFWLRILEGLGGIILLGLGLVALAGGSPSGIARTAARVA